MKKTGALLLVTAAILAACGVAVRSPRLAAPLTYAPVAAPSDEAFRATPPPAGPLSTAPSLRLQTSRLANGVEIVLVERHDLPLYAARLLVNRGARDIGRRAELVDLAAWEVVTAHESSAHARAEVQPMLECNADRCAAAVGGLSRSIEAGLGVLARLASQPTFAEARLSAVRKEWTERKEQMTGRLEGAVTQNVEALLFPPEDPYSFVGPADRAAIDGVKMADLAEVYGQVFHPEHATLIVAGDIGAARLTEVAQAAFGSWRSARPRVVQSAVVPPLPGSKVRTVLVAQRAALVHAYIVARGPLPSDPSMDALSLLATVIGTPSGALFEEVRSGMNAAYDVDASMTVGRAGTWWTIGGAFEPAKASQALQAVLAAVRRAREEGVAAPDLEGGRARLIAGLRADAGTTAGVTALLSQTLARGLPVTDALLRPGRIGDLTAEDLRKAARTWLSEDSLRLVVVGPRKAIERGFTGVVGGEAEWRDDLGEVER